jgi:hypothetical protein
VKPPHGLCDNGVRWHQVLRESISDVEHFQIGEKYGDGEDDQLVVADSVDFKRGGGGAGSKAHGQIDVYEGRCVNGDESAGDAE